MSYRMKIDRKSLNSARFISMLQRKIQDALIASGMTQQDVAEKLGVGRSVINRRLSGKANLTARSLAEFAYAFDKELIIEYRDKAENSNVNWNYVRQTSSPEITQPLVRSMNQVSSTTASKLEVFEQVS